MKKQVRNPLLCIPDYNGAGVYALVDEYNKKYIGSSIHVRDRIKRHKSCMLSSLRDGHNCFLNPKIERALHLGAVFSCEVLCEVHSDVSRYELEEIERIFLDKFGGFDGTYNYKPIRHRV